MLGNGGMCIYRVREPKPFVAMGCICTAFSTLLEGHDLGLSKTQEGQWHLPSKQEIFQMQGHYCQRRFPEILVLAYGVLGDSSLVGTPGWS